MKHRIQIFILLCIFLAFSSVLTNAAWAAKSTPKLFDSTQYRGKVVYVVFWASWCQRCGDALRWVESLQVKYGDQGLNVVIVTLDAVAKRAMAFLQKESVNLPLFHDPHRQLAAKYQLYGMPSAVILDRESIVRFRQSMIKKSQRRQIEKNINDILADTAVP